MGYVHLLVKAYGVAHTIPVIAVAPQFTSQQCSACDAMVKKSLSVRTHICTSCGVVLDRDHNAALNILEKALACTLGHREHPLRRKTLLDRLPLPVHPNGLRASGLDEGVTTRHLCG